jgi:SAM-dependent methyltransferase
VHPPTQHAAVPELRPTDRDHADAQRIAFAPLLFEAARIARDAGALERLSRAFPSALTLSDIASGIGLNAYPTGLLVEACVSLGMVSREEQRYRLTGVGLAFLTDTRARVSTDFVHHVCYRGAYMLEEALRSGTPAGLATLGGWSTIYEGIPDLPEATRRSWYAFDHLYSDGVFPRAVRVLGQRRVERVLDIGSNTGRFATLAAASMDVTMVDHETELRVARRNVDEAGVGARVTTAALDLRDPTASFPTGYDAVWMSQVLDCFGEDEIVSILERARRALRPGGRAYVVESFTDRQPTEAARVALHGLSLYFACIANGTSRMYGSTDLLRCASAAGLVVDEDRTLGPWHTLLILRPEEPARAS